MSTRTTSKTSWTMPAVDEQTALWGAATFAVITQALARSGFG
ncbi:hypothetical protein AAII07_22895 [Microvirga sp. 0TCS3.31]